MDGVNYFLYIETQFKKIIQWRIVLELEQK